MQSVQEEPYTKEDLVGLKKHELIELVQREIEKWPYSHFSPSHTTVATIRSVLLNPTCGFLKAVQEHTEEAEQQDAADAGTAESPVNQAVALGGVLGFDDEQDVANMAAESPAEHEGVMVEPVEVDLPAMHTVHVFITYSCSGQVGPLLKSCTLSLPVHSQISCHPNEWNTETTKFLEQLQGSSAAIQDSKPVLLSYPDPILPAFKHCFLRTHQGSSIAQTVPDEPVLRVRRGEGDISSFHLMVDEIMGDSVSVQPMVHHKAPQSEVNVHSTLPQPSGSITTPALATQSMAGTSQAGDESQQVNWLRQQAQQYPGYAFYRAAQHRSATVTNIIASWQFAARFTNEFNKKSASSAGVSGCFTKKMIQQALKVGATWLTEAETATAVLDLYGPSGRVHSLLVDFICIASWSPVYD